MPTSSNLLPLLIQQALNRAHPQPLPSNTVITNVLGPYGGAYVGDSVKVSTTSLASMVWGGLFPFSGWSGCTLSDVNTSARPGSAILSLNGSSYYTSGTIQSGSLDLSEVAAVSASCQIFIDSNLPTLSTAVAIQVRFSSDGSTWGGWQSVVNGQVLSSIARYAEVLGALATTDTSQTPQLNRVSFAVASPALWNEGQYDDSPTGSPDSLTWTGILDE